MIQARPPRSSHRRAGNVLVMFAIGLIGMLAFAALVVDVGLVMLTRRQMQTAVNTAALEGLRFQDDPAFTDDTVRDGERRERASALVAAVFDDNLDPSDGDEKNFGAGPQVTFDDEPTDIPLPDTNFRASRLIKSENVGVYKPRQSNGTPETTDDLPGVELNLSNQVHGDLMAGYWCFDPNELSRDSHAEANDYSREDVTLDEDLVVTELSQPVAADDTTISVNATAGFPVSPFRPFLIRIEDESMSVTAAVGTTWTVTRGSSSQSHVMNSQVVLVLPASFLARMRRTNEDFSGDVGVASAGPTVPFLFGRGAVIRDADGGTELFNRRERGTIVRATAIAIATPALTVGVPVEIDGVMGPDPNREGVSFFWLEQAAWTAAPAGALAIAISPTGLITGDVSGQFVSNGTTRQVIRAGDALPVAQPAPADLELGQRRFVPLYENIGGTMLVVGFGVAILDSATSVQKLPGMIASENASNALTSPSSSLTAAQWTQLFALQATILDSLVKAPARARAIP